jgi:hypothetical protein
MLKIEYSEMNERKSERNMMLKVVEDCLEILCRKYGEN